MYDIFLEGKLDIFTSKDAGLRLSMNLLDKRCIHEINSTLNSRCKN